MKQAIRKYLSVALLCFVCVAAGGCAEKQVKEYYPPKIVINETVYKTRVASLGSIVRQLEDNAILEMKKVDGENRYVAVYSGLQKQYLKKGDRVRVHVGETVYPATLVKMAGEIFDNPLEEGDVWFVFDDSWPGLNLSLNSRVTIEGKFEEKSDVIVVPRTYVYKGADDSYFVKLLIKNSDGVEVKTRVPVTIGIQTSSGTEIVDGISVGDVIVID